MLDCEQSLSVLLISVSAKFLPLPNPSSLTFLICIILPSLCAWSEEKSTTGRSLPGMLEIFSLTRARSPPYDYLLTSYYDHIFTARRQSRNREFPGSLASVLSPGETGVLDFLPQDFCGKTMQAVLGSANRLKIEIFSNCPESLLATNHWPKSLRTLGTRLGPKVIVFRRSIVLPDLPPNWITETRTKKTATKAFLSSYIIVTENWCNLCC